MKKLLLIICLSATCVFTQEAAPDLDRPDPSRMEMMALWRLTDHLKLTTDQAEIFFPVMRAHKEAMGDLNRQRIEVGKTMLDRAERGESISDKEFGDFLNQVADIEKEKIQLRKKYFKDLEGRLTNTQLIKLMIFDEKFKNELKRQAREKRDRLDRSQKMMGKSRRPRDHK